ncbi:MAG: PrpF family protein [Rhodospirillales bacterium]|nr:PrpF family protein [Rhodospirillales bacterium]
MSQIALPAVFMRGGTSKGLFFHQRDLPAERAERDALFLAALGSPDPHGRQLDGMGGGISSLSKVVVVSPSARPGVDIDYLFAQVAVDRALVDYRSNCGNLTAAVGPFAVDERLVQAADGEVALTLHNCNLDQTIEARFAVADRRAVVEGRTVLDGVSGRGAPIHLSFMDPGGAVTGRLLPTGQARDVLDVPGSSTIEATLIDASTALVIVRADAIGLSGIELPDAIEAYPALTERLEAIRRAGAVAMGIDPETESVPKVGFVAPPADAATLSGERLAADAVDLTARAISMGRPHRALPLTAALALAAAARIPGSVAAQVARPGADSHGPVRLGHPSGVAEISAELAATEPPCLARLTVTRTARRLMEGRVLVPALRLASPSETD